MRRHAKAATAGSKPQQAAKLALPASLFAALVALVVVAGSASAANGVVNFFGGEGVEGGQFSSSSSGPGGVAVNQAGTGGAGAGDVYVVDRGNRRVQQFEADGTWVRAFGKDVGGAGVDVCEVAASCVAATANAEAGAMNNPQGIAIDQANGNVFVSDQTNRRIDVFSAEGDFQAAFGYGVDTGGAALELCTTASTCAAGTSGANAGQFGAQIGYPAIAPAGSPNAGDLYVGNKSNRRVDQFSIELTGSEVTGVSFVKGWGWGVDDGASEFQQCTTASVCQAPNTSSPTTNPGQFSSNQPQAVAVDSAGSVYTAESAGNNRPQKFDSEGNPAPFNGADLAGSPGPIDIAVDPTNDHVFGLKEPSGAGEKRVLELNASGALIATHASGTTITSANGLAVVDGTTNFYVSTNPQSDAYRGVFFLGTKVNPTASSEAPSPLSSHTATLKGKVNPKGFTTTYQFEFSRDNGASWEKLPENPVDAGNGEADVPVEQEVTGLIGSSSYRYKVVATKPFGAGSATSNTTTFVAPASAPTVPATFTTAVTSKTAVLNAEINPNNEATVYRFEYGTADCASNPCSSIPVPDAGIGSGSTPVGVAKEITGLTPDTIYHFRVVATNATGVAATSDRVFQTYPVLSPDATCVNQERRSGVAARLPNCRAYEMVSPIDKNGGSAYPPSCCGSNGIAYFEQSSLDGEKITYTSGAAYGDQVGHGNSAQYIARRTSTGWSNHGITPPLGTKVFAPFLPNPQYQLDAPFQAFTPDLSSAWVLNGNKVPLTDDAVTGFGNLYRRDNLTDGFEALTRTEPTSFRSDEYGNGLGIEFRNYSEDLRHQVFDATAALTPDAASGENRQIYDLVDGDLHLVSVLPDGTAAAGESWVGTFGRQPTSSVYTNSRRANVEDAVSNDGSRIFWTTDAPRHSSEGAGSLYVRKNPAQPQSALNGADECTEPEKACTITIFKAAGGEKARFWAADKQGARMLFSVRRPSSPEVDNVRAEDLYEFDVETQATTLLAGKVAGVLGTGDDMAHVYFVSREALAPGSVAEDLNLYLLHAGDFTFIGALGQPDVTASSLSGHASAVSLSPYFRASRVTPDGRHIVFQSIRSLTGYDNTDLTTGQPTIEVFVYEAGGEVACVSCNPSGSRPNARPLAFPFFPTLPEDILAAAWITTWGHSLSAPHVLANDGSRVFFNAFDSLLPQDSNGEQDVYQWEAPGTHGCARDQGCLSLISTGESSPDSAEGGDAEFIDASIDGDDVFFRTSQSLDPDDPGSIDIYNARVNGGFAPEISPPACIGDACQNVPAAPADSTPASASFRGAGDPRARQGHGSCRSTARRARRLSRRARQVRVAAKRARQPSSKRRARQQARRLSAQARRLSRSAKRCRTVGRRARR